MDHIDHIDGPDIAMQWKRNTIDILRAGSAASIASAIVLAIVGRIECNDAASPINGPSQWVWGRGAPYRRGFSVRHTVVGYAIHHLASTLWAALYAWIGRRRPVAGAVATAAAAAYVDFRLTPERFTPGFQHRLSKRALVMVYAAFAVGLVASRGGRPGVSSDQARDPGRRARDRSLTAAPARHRSPSPTRATAAS